MSEKNKKKTLEPRIQVSNEGVFIQANKITLGGKKLTKDLQIQDLGNSNQEKQSHHLG